jgi:zinc-ribbon domain
LVGKTGILALSILGGIFYIFGGIIGAYFIAGVLAGVSLQAGQSTASLTLAAISQQYSGLISALVSVGVITGTLIIVGGGMMRSTGRTRKFGAVLSLGAMIVGAPATLGGVLIGLIFTLLASVLGLRMKDTGFMQSTQATVPSYSGMASPGGVGRPRYCVRCGTPVYQDDRFCPNCGYAIDFVSPS